MSDVAANGSGSPDANPQSTGKDDEDREARGLPASDPESGA
ncbi:hypothetical protein [Pseudomonas sputi]|nr:hypothetical protein [Pseudomonas sputi]